MYAAWWCNSYGVELATEGLRERFPAVPLPGNTLGQVVHTQCASVTKQLIWQQSKGGDALRLGR